MLYLLSSGDVNQLLIFIVNIIELVFIMGLSVIIAKNPLAYSFFINMLKGGIWLINVKFNVVKIIVLSKFHCFSIVKPHFTLYFYVFLTLGRISCYNLIYLIYLLYLTVCELVYFIFKFIFINLYFCTSTYIIINVRLFLLYFMYDLFSKSIENISTININNIPQFDLIWSNVKANMTNIQNDYILSDYKMYLLISMMFLVYYMWYSYMIFVQNSLLEKSLNLSLANKIKVIKPFVYIILFFFIFCGIGSVWLETIVILYTDIELFNLMVRSINYTWVQFELHFDNIIDKTKQKNFFNYICFSLFQIIFALYICTLSNYFLIFIYSLLLSVGNILLINFIIKLEILNKKKILFAIVIVSVYKLTGFSVFMFMLGNIKELFGSLGLLLILNNILELCSFDLIFSQKRVNLYMTNVKNFIQQAFGFLDKVKLTQKIKNFLIGLSYLLVDCILKMDSSNPWGSTGSALYNNPSVLSGDLRPIGRNPGGGDSNILDMIQGKDEDEELTAHLTEDRREIARTWWFISRELIQETGLNVKGTLSYDKNLNAFYINHHEDFIAHRQFIGGVVSYRNLTDYNLFLVIMRGYLCQGVVDRNRLVSVPIHLIKQRPNFPVYLTTSVDQLETWGIIMPSLYDTNYTLTINYEPLNAFYNHEQSKSNPSLDNIREGLIYLNNSRSNFTILNSTILDHTTQIFLIEFLQDFRPDLFDRLMVKDTFKRLVYPHWPNLSVSDVITAINQKRGVERSVLLHEAARDLININNPFRRI